MGKGLILKYRSIAPLLDFSFVVHGKSCLGGLLQKGKRAMTTPIEKGVDTDSNTPIKNQTHKITLEKDSDTIIRPRGREFTRTIPITQLRPYANIQLKINVDGPDHELARIIKISGVVENIVARFTFKKDDKGEEIYEIISDHNIFAAAKYAELNRVPVRIINANDDQADLMVWKSNLIQKKKFYSYLGKAMKRKLHALKRQGQRSTDPTSVQFDKKLSRDVVASMFNTTGSTVHRLVRLTYLIPEFQHTVDMTQMTLAIGENISYLRETEQKILHQILLEKKLKLTLPQSKVLKDESCILNNNKEKADISKERIEEIISDNGNDDHQAAIKPPKKIYIPYKSISRYFEGQDLTVEAIRDIILKAVEEHYERNE
jgi:ParB-like chromosome segregation protein Spo0J